MIGLCKYEKSRLVYSILTCFFPQVALNDQGLIEQLLRDEYIIGFMGILECKLLESSVYYHCIINYLHFLL